MNTIWQESFKSFTFIGEGTRKFLHGQTSADVLGCVEGETIKACALAPDGKLSVLLEIKLIDKGADVIVLSGDGDSFFLNLERGIFPADKVQIISTTNIIRIQELSLEKSWKDSFSKWFYPKDKLALDSYKSIKNATSYDYKIWRIKQGFPFKDNEINGDNNPYELGLYDLIELDKGCYLGQESMSRIFSGGKIKQKLRCFEADANVLNLIVGQKLFFKDADKEISKSCGFITSLERSKDDRYFGLSMIKTKVCDVESLFIINSSEELIMRKPISFVDIT